MGQFELFADALWQFHRLGHAALRTERADGYRSDEDVSWFFTSYSEFPRYEKSALRFVRGRVLDVGCGAGRHALYFQRRGLRVTAIDTDARIVELAQARGVRDARVANACLSLPFRNGEFETVVLFGNNLGIGGTPGRLRAMLRELYRVTSPRGRLIGTTIMPSTRNPLHRSYLRNNLRENRALGQIRLRLLFDRRRGPWFDLLLLAPTDLMQIAHKEGWELIDIAADNYEEGYAAVLEKAPRKAQG